MHRYTHWTASTLILEEKKNLQTSISSGDVDTHELSESTLRIYFKQKIAKRQSFIQFVSDYIVINMAEDHWDSANGI